MPRAFAAISSRCLLVAGCVSLIACAVASPGSDGVAFEAGPEAASDASRVDVGDADDAVTPTFDVFEEPTFDVVEEEVADTFVLTCTDTTYDVNGDPADGCEVTDPLAIHTEGSAHDFGPMSDHDTDGKSLSSTFPSDDRQHLPSTNSGALGLPVWFSATHNASTLYVNDPTVNVSMTGGASKYRVTFFHGDGSVDPCSPVDIDGSTGTGDVKCAKTTDGEVVHIKLEKLSGPRENAAYTVSYHN